MIKNQERKNFKEDKAKWYFIQTQCTDLLKAGFAPTVIGYTYKLQPGRVNRLVRSLRQNASFASLIPALTGAGREYNYMTHFALRTTQDKADASLFALIYSSLCGGDIYEEINIWAVADAYRLFLREIAPRTAKQTVLNTINRAWSLANSFILETGELAECRCCGQKYYNKLSGKQISLKCPMCSAQKNQKAAPAEQIPEPETAVSAAVLPLSCQEKSSEEAPEIRRNEPEKPAARVSFMEEFSAMFRGFEGSEEPEKDTEEEAKSRDEREFSEPSENKKQPASEKRGLSILELMAC